MPNAWRPVCSRSLSVKFFGFMLAVTAALQLCLLLAYVSPGLVHASVRTSKVHSGPSSKWQETITLLNNPSIDDAELMLSISKLIMKDNVEVWGYPARSVIAHLDWLKDSQLFGSKMDALLAPARDSSGHHGPKFLSIGYISIWSLAALPHWIVYHRYHGISKALLFCEQHELCRWLERHVSSSIVELAYYPMYNLHQIIKKYAGDGATVVVRHNVSQFIESLDGALSRAPFANADRRYNCNSPCAIFSSEGEGSLSGNMVQSYENGCAHLKWFIWLPESEGLVWQTLLQHHPGDTVPLQALQHTTWLGTDEDKKVFESFGLL